MSQGLFRKEVLEAKRTSWLGRISLTQPLSLWVLTGCAVLAFLAVVTFLVFGSYTHRERVSGRLIPSSGLSIVLAPATGVVSTVDVSEGTFVQVGQRLAIVTIPSATAVSSNTADTLERNVLEKEQGLAHEHVAQSALLSTQSLGLNSQLDIARREIRHMQSEIATQQRQIDVENESLERLKIAESQKLVSTLQLKQQEALVLAQTGQLQALQRQRIELQRATSQLVQQLHAIPEQQAAAQAGYRRDHAGLEQERVEAATRGSLQIDAPVRGQVVTQVSKQGQTVQIGQPIMSLLPAGALLQAELLVPSQAVGFIEQGDTVLLRYQAFPYQKFGHHVGKVAHVGRSSLTTEEMAVLGIKGSSNETFYRVIVTLSKQSVTAYGKQEMLKPGMLLEADVLGEKRSLIEWIFEPLYSLKGQIR